MERNKIKLEGLREELRKSNGENEKLRGLKKEDNVSEIEKEEKIEELKGESLA